MTSITQRPFFTLPTGESAVLYILRNAGGMEVAVSNYGGIIYRVTTADRDGNFADVALGYDTYEAYRARKTFFGAMVGRCCNRIGKGKFTLNGEEYQLACNDNGLNHLHGGTTGLDTKLFDAAVKQDCTGDVLCLRTSFADGEEGYPGGLTVEITCTLSDQNQFSLHYVAQAVGDTLCSLTNHCYFNLAGHGAGSILDHKLRICADTFTEADAESIPTGRVLPVAETPMDFREFHAIGERIDADYLPLKNGCGYDHNWVLNAGNHQMELCAELYHEESGRLLRCFTNSPCIQVYTGNFVDGSLPGKDGAVYARRGGIALETQFAPDAVNHPGWDSPVLKDGDVFDYTTVFQFTTV